jgi:hypothetical protein
MLVSTNWIGSDMNKIAGCGRPSVAMVVVALFAVMLAGNLPSHAQEISQSHIAAAKKTIAATDGTVDLNKIIPRAANRLASQLISNRPDIEKSITQFIQDSSLELAPRRGDLEKEVIKIYARVFTEKELLEIAAFFSTDSGKKFLKDIPVAARETERAARIWQTGIARDMTRKVREKINAANLQ